MEYSQKLNIKPCLSGGSLPVGGLGGGGGVGGVLS